MNNSSTVNHKTTDWHAIDWQNAYAQVKNLRQRIFKARTNGDWKKVRGLQKLMLRSRANLLTSVRKVTQINQGKSTPGVDRYVALLPTERSLLIDQLLNLARWKPFPARRIYIPKTNGKKRPLGIPSLIDRCQQAMVKNALEPCWEAIFEETSYGFRPGRSVHDAIEWIYLATKSGSRRTWILDADIKGCFDNIDHNSLMKTIGSFPARGLIKKWLKSGYVDKGVFFRTEQGTPQGGIISPLLANIALHGMESWLGIKYRGGVSSDTIKPACPVIVRYADDFVVLCHTKEEAVEAKEKIKAYLIQEGHEVIDKGALSFDKDDDYPDFIIPVAQAVSTDKGAKGIILGGTGQGEAITANRIKGIRAVVFNGQYEPYDGREVPDEIIMSREHNDANIISIGARFLTADEAKRAITKWLSTPFSEDERHIRRLQKIDSL